MRKIKLRSIFKDYVKAIIFKDNVGGKFIKMKDLKGDEIYLIES